VCGTDGSGKENIYQRYGLLMRKLTAALNVSPGSIGQPTLKVMCPHAGWPIPAEGCRPRYCKANIGFKEYIKDGALQIETLCGLEEYEAEKEKKHGATTD
jgi:hypothetical protein